MKLLPALLLSLLLTTIARAEEIHLAAAISLKETLTQITKTYKADTGEEVTLTLGSSGQLSTQIKNGADIDLFISAGSRQVEDLDKAGLTRAATQRTIASNTLVLIVPATSAIVPASFADLASDAYKRIAIGDPKSVPAGDYALQTLTALKLQDVVAPRLIYGTNVRQVLTYVESAEVSAGIVYGTDAHESGNKVKIAATADEKTHAPIVYPAVILKGSKKQEAALKFLTYLQTEKSRQLFKEKGFSLPAEPATTAPSAHP